MADGLVVVDKPAGMTSHDVVARCRRIFGQKRVGHAGTLDPDATGVLLVGLGRATRLMQFLTGMTKSYAGEIVLGVATTTLDAAGTEIGRWDMRGVTLEAARAAALQLTGTIQQVPPMVSALKVGGRRLHELAREGVEVERAPRTVTVSRFELSWAAEARPGQPPMLAAEVDCSSGTYIRSLAGDLGALLGGGAHLRSLRRTAVGPYTLADAVPLDQVSQASILPPAQALGEMGAVTAPAEMEAAVGHGAVLDRAAFEAAGAVGAGPWAVLGARGELLAVYRDHPPGRVKPIVVLAGT